MEADKTLENLVDLHLHLGSSSTPHFLWELAHEQGIRLPEKNYWKFIASVTINKKTTYDNYLSFFNLTERIQSSSYAIEKAVHSAISRYYRDADVRTLEVRFNPMFRNKGGEQDLDKIILAATIGMKKACLEYPVKAGIILMMDRRFDKEKNLIIAKKAVRYKKEGVVGIDLAGPIKNSFSIDSIIEPVRLAKKAGLKITIHTGEITGTTEIWQVLNKLEPDRIGHGIRAVDDPHLLQKLANDRVVLEICPTSNIRTQAVKNWQELGEIIKTLQKYGVLFTINSDGPEFLHTNVKKELLTLLKKNILSFAEVKNAVELARRSTFINND